MRLLLESNIFIQVMVKDDRHLKRQMNIHSDQIVLSTVVLFELFAGAHDSRRRREQLEELDGLALPVLPFDATDARAAGEIKADLKRKGTPIGPYDILIAGQARARGLTVVTRNVGEFRRVEGLRWRSGRLERGSGPPGHGRYAVPRHSPANAAPFRHAVACFKRYPSRL